MGMMVIGVAGIVMGIPIGKGLLVAGEGDLAVQDAACGDQFISEVGATFLGGAPGGW